MAMGAWECFQCEVEPQRRDSHFCSAECREKYAATMAESISCHSLSADHFCSAEADGLDAAARAGWTDIEPDPEGSSWNYRGCCPDCGRCPPD